jgi:hypothetical protein
MAEGGFASLTEHKKERRMSAAEPDTQRIAFKCTLPGCEARVPIEKRLLTVDDTGALVLPVFNMCPKCGWFQEMMPEKEFTDLLR